MTLAQQIALWADKLRDISAMGLLFSKDIHDETAFRGVQSIALEMMALATGRSPERMEPLVAPLLDRPTPLTVGDAAVIDEQGQMLLVRRSDNGKWAMPGGALEVGETPAEGVAREVWEETGVRCRPVSLVGVFDSRLCHTPSPFHLYHFTFLCHPVSRELPGEASHSIEVLETGWFREAGLPKELDAGHATRIPIAFRVWHGDEQAYFDGAVSKGGGDD